MPTSQTEVATPQDLCAATTDPEIGEILVTADLADVPSVRLAPGQTLCGSGQTIRFAAGEDGIRLTTGNTVRNLHLAADPDRAAIWNDTTVPDLGRLHLHDLRITGVVRLLARDQVRSGHVEAQNIDIIAADARHYEGRPKGYGVEVVAGVFTVWNQQPDRAIVITANLTGLQAGRAGAPVRGSGIFISGSEHTGGRLTVRQLETGPVFSDGGIVPGTADRISGGVFAVSGAVVDTVRNNGTVTTYGPNDMVLDNWGTVDEWVVEAKITSFGPSGIGFVNFGIINRLIVKAPIETFGQGARGFNVYTGTVGDATFERIVTHGDGAVGIQISQPVGRISVRNGITTHGGIGDSLVKGVVRQLPATGFSIKPGGSAQSVTIAGGLTTHAPGVEALELHGRIETLHIGDGLAANGQGFAAI